MKYFFLAAALLAFGGCSKDDAQNNCCNNSNFKVVSPHANLTILPPNVITPNGDGRNDHFLAVGFDKARSTPQAQITFATQRIVVYYPGASVEAFRSTTYMSEFDGHDQNGAELPEDTYRYELTLDDNTVTGNVCVVRRQSACNCRAIDPDDPLLGTCQ